MEIKNQYQICLKCNRPYNAPREYAICKCKEPELTRGTYDLPKRLRKFKLPNLLQYMSKILGKEQKIELDYWKSRNKFPIGTFHHPWSYSDWEGMPEEEIAFIPYQSIDINLTQREALNIMHLGKSGGGKTKLIKNVWFGAHNAGFKCVYFDPKSFDSGRAHRPWMKSAPEYNICPHIKPEGIQLQHFIPSWIVPGCEEIALCKGNRFKFYEIKLSNMTQMDMWMSLGVMSGAVKVVEIIKRYNSEKKKITFPLLKLEVLKLTKMEINTNTKNDIIAKLEQIMNAQIVGENKLQFLKEFAKGNSVCISYADDDKIYMAFDIGMMIKTLSKINKILPESERRPIMLFLDDGSMYLQRLPNGRPNFAMKQTEYVGNNYRSLGLNNFMAVQSLSIVDSSVSEIYKWKIIDPLFPNPTQLSSIGIPWKAIDLLKMNYLTVEPDNFIIENLLINNKNEVVPFFPFIASPCGHLQEVYNTDTTIGMADMDV